MLGYRDFVMCVFGLCVVDSVLVVYQKLIFFLKMIVHRSQQTICSTTPTTKTSYLPSRSMCARMY